MALREIALALALGLGGAAAGETLNYDVTYGPLRVGRLVLDSRTDAEGYSAGLSIRSAGLAGVVRAVRFEARAQGRPGDLPQPGRYEEEADTGRRVSSVRIDWPEGRPVVGAYRADPPEEVPAPSPDAAAGALDPASAFLAALSGAQVCGLSFAVFDGQRLSAVALAPGVAEGGLVICDGRFRRVAGYRPADLEERRSFTLRLVYAPEGAGFVLREAEVQTLYGKVRLKRR
jgi:hypothetical protein